MSKPIAPHALALLRSPRRELGQSLTSALGPTVFEGDVLAVNVARNF
jgi:hypothetical protein